MTFISARDNLFPFAAERGSVFWWGGAAFPAARRMPLRSLPNKYGSCFYKSAAIPCMPTRRSSARAMCAWGRAAGWGSAARLLWRERGARFAGCHFSGLPHPPPKMGLCGQALYRRYPCGEGGPGGWPAFQWKDHLPAGYSRSLSLGRFASGRRVAIVDERGELGGFDLGPCADILRGYPKETGLEVALRTLSPEVIVCDELSQRISRRCKGRWPRGWRWSPLFMEIQAGCCKGPCAVPFWRAEPSRLWCA